METVADRYELLEVVGVGAACLVHRGRDRETGATVAVKIYRADGSALDRLQQRREMAALARLRHPGLVTLLDGGTEAGPTGRTYVVTDFVEGCTLSARLADGPLGPDEVRDLGIRLADALAHVHAAGFVHRDVKPANVLLADGTRPLLADFGIARAVDGTVATGTGRVAGTAAYLSPEQVRGGEIAAPVDVYALGLVLLECLTGRREYPGTSAESLIARLHRRPRVPEGLPWGLSAVLAAMTADNPAARPDASAVASALSRAERKAPVVAPGPSRRLRWAVATAAAGVLLGVPVVGATLLGTAADPLAPAAVAGPDPGTHVTASAPAGPASSVPVHEAVAVAAAPVTGSHGVAVGVPAPAPARGGSADEGGTAGGDTATEGGATRDTTPAARSTVGTVVTAVTAAVDNGGNGNGNGGGNGNGNGKSKGNGKGNNGNGNGNGKGNNGNGKGNGGGNDQGED